jgi:hypothetical protein
MKKSAWESKKGNGFWTFLECPKLNRDERLSEKLVL